MIRCRRAKAANPDPWAVKKPVVFWWVFGGYLVVFWWVFGGAADSTGGSEVTAGQFCIFDVWERHCSGHRSVMSQTLMNMRASHPANSGVFGFANLGKSGGCRRVAVKRP